MFTDLNAEMIKFQILNDDAKFTNQIKNLSVEVYFINLKDKQQNFKGFEIMKQIQQKKKQSVRAIVCGGDGTITWVVQEMVNHGCSIDNIPLGTIPFGTGNDFSQVLGWGGTNPDELFNKNFLGFKILIKNWINSLIEDFDIWDVIIEFQDHGELRIVKKQEKGGFIKTKYDDQNLKNKTTFVKQMTNYMSIGVESRIGFGFDKSRTQSQCCNKCVYCWEGFKKMFLSTKTIKNVLSSFEQFINKNSNQKQLNEQEIDLEDIKLQSQKICIQKEQNQLKNDNGEVYFSGNPVTLFVQNVNSFSGGIFDSWKAAHNQIGIEYFDGTRVKDQFDVQNFGDGKLEFMCFYSISGLGNERFIRGQSKRVAQGTGPFVMNFKQDEKLVTYCQIDGEYYQIFAPKNIQLKQSQITQNSKIKVLVNRCTRETNC